MAIQCSKYPKSGNSQHPESQTEVKWKQSQKLNRHGPESPQGLVGRPRAWHVPTLPATRVLFLSKGRVWLWNRGQAISARARQGAVQCSTGARSHCRHLHPGKRRLRLRLPGLRWVLLVSKLTLRYALGICRLEQTLGSCVWAPGLRRNAQSPAPPAPESEMPATRGAWMNSPVTPMHSTAGESEAQWDRRTPCQDPPRAPAADRAGWTSRTRGSLLSSPCPPGHGSRSEHSCSVQSHGQRCARDPGCSRHPASDTPWPARPLCPHSQAPAGLWATGKKGPAGS